MELIEIKDVFQMDCGAPSPLIMSSDRDLILLFLPDLYEEDGHPQEFDVRDLTLTIALKFKYCMKYSFGTPSNELLYYHPYRKMGIESCAFYEVKDSPMIEELRNLAKNHQYYSDNSWKEYKHFVITFHDDMFECIAKSYAVRMTNISLHKKTEDYMDEICRL